MSRAFFDDDIWGEVMTVYNWNPVFNLVMQIKNDYKEKFGSIDTVRFEDWLLRLNNKKYIDIFCHLKVNQHNNFILIRYGMDEMHESMWTDPESIYRECRSVVIDILNDQLVIAPFRKKSETVGIPSSFCNIKAESIEAIE